jgi:hypothetical protein
LVRATIKTKHHTGREGVRAAVGAGIKQRVAGTWALLRNIVQVATLAKPTREVAVPSVGPADCEVGSAVHA